MKLEEYVYQDQKRLRCGYTTGSCAAAAAKAAAQMLLTNKWVNEVELCTPKGIRLLLPICRTQRSEASVSCAVQKDSGDDPDVTDGIFDNYDFDWGERLETEPDDAGLTVDERTEAEQSE